MKFFRIAKYIVFFLLTFDNDPDVVPIALIWGLVWYTPQMGAAEFDDSVFSEIETHNLDILVRLDIF